MNRQRGRPPRLSNILVTDPIYFVTFCTWQRAPTLASPAIDRAFRQTAREIGIHTVAVGKYMIMPDHIHCFIRVGREGRIGLAIKALKRAITKTIHTIQHDKRVWQEGFFDHILRSSESYSKKWEYVQANAVRAGLVKRAEEWPFQGEVENIRW